MMDGPLAYHLTWTTYGTWLPGDERGWVQDGTFGVQEPDPARSEAARRRMGGPAVLLDDEGRALVEATVRAHCEVRSWRLHALNARTNHVHLVVTAVDERPETVLNQLKAWCSRRLNERDLARGLPPRQRWWTHHGSTRWINDEDYFHAAVRYVLERQ